MARKRFLLFRAIQPILKYGYRRLYWRRFRILSLALFTLFLTLNVPILSGSGSDFRDRTGSKQTIEINSTSVAIDSSLQQPSFLISEASNALKLNQEGKELYEKGLFSEAAELWQQAAKRYAEEGNEYGKTESLINKSEALQALGLSFQACNTLLQAFGVDRLDCQTLIQNNKIFQEQTDSQTQEYQISKKQINSFFKTLEEQPDSLNKATGLRRLGDVFQRLGDLDLSQTVLEISKITAQNLSSAQEESAALLSLGNIARAMSNRERDRKNPVDVVYDPISLGENPVEAPFKRYKKAFDFYQQAANKSPSIITKIHAELNQLNLFLEIKKWWAEATKKDTRAVAYWPQLEDELTKRATILVSDNIQSHFNNSLPLTSKAVFTRITFAEIIQKVFSNEFLDRHPDFQTQNSKFRSLAENMLIKAVQDSQSLRNQRLQAYAFGSLGGLYEKQGLQGPTQQNKFLLQAKDTTEQALKRLNWSTKVDSINVDKCDFNAYDRNIAYRWQWQLGRILKAQGKSQEAIAAYHTAFRILQCLRKDLVTINKDIQFYFRDEVEPFYRQYAGLLLQPNNLLQDNLPEARKVIEALQLAEIDNFFQDPCSEKKQESKDIDKFIDENAKNSAVIYTILEEEGDDTKLNIILKMPNQNLIYRSNKVSKIKFNNTIYGETGLYKTIQEAVAYITTKNLEPVIEKEYTEKNKPIILPLLQELYNLLILPIEADLTGVNTLVFVLDEQLRNIPIAALYDGSKYLVENYSIAFSLGLQLTEPEPLERENRLRVLAAGVSKENKKFGLDALPNVEREVNQITDKLPGSVKLLDKKFTKENFRDTLNSFRAPVVHLATHGTFSFNPEQTFIATVDSKLSIEDLENLLRGTSRSRSSAIKLLVLSACKTAQGERRAVLGLAGVAVRAGAGSTLAPLWEVKDKITADLMIDFYQQLATTNVNKAEALSHAQRDLIRSQDYNHPVYWAPYVIVGNWL